MAPPPVSFSHFGIYVTDIARMEQFYTRALGFIVTDKGKIHEDDLVFMSRDPAEHHQMIMSTGRPRDLGFNIVHQISFKLDSLADLRAIRDRLAHEGATQIVCSNHGISWSIYARDPEGNRLEIFTESPWYIPQPVRDPLDLSLSDEEIFRATETRCKATEGYRPMAEWRAALAARIEAAKSAQQ